MNEPATILANNTAVRTHKQLESPQGMVAMPTLIANRRPDAAGVIHGIVPGHGGDVYWVKHEDGKIAPYVFSEFELVPSTDKVLSAILKEKLISRGWSYRRRLMSSPGTRVYGKGARGTEIYLTDLEEISMKEVVKAAEVIGCTVEELLA